MNPRIYYVANARMPSDRAYGIQLAKMCEALVEAGAELTLVIPRRSGGGDISSFYGLRRSVSVKRLPVPSFFPQSRFWFNMRAALFGFEAAIFIMLRRIADRNPFVIYTIDLDQLSFYPLAFLGAPCCMEFHSTKQKNVLYRSFLRRAAGVIVINGRVGDDMAVSFGVPRGNIVLAPNGSDPAFFGRAPSRAEARRLLGIPEGARVVLHTGRLYAWKGLDVLLLAARLLPETLFYVVGGTREELKDICKNMEVPPNVLCVGHRPYEEIPRWLSAGDALLTLGTKGNEYSYRGTSPMKLFEYLESGRPIIASRTPANAEIVGEREVFFYEPDNAESLRDAVRAVFRDTRGAEERARRAKEKAKEYSWANRANKILTFIRHRHI